MTPEAKHRRAGLLVTLGFVGVMSAAIPMEQSCHEAYMRAIYESSRTLRADFLDLKVRQRIDSNNNRMIEPGEVRDFLDEIGYRDRIFAGDYVQVTKHADNIRRVGGDGIVVPIGIAEDYLSMPRSGV